MTLVCELVSHMYSFVMSLGHHHHVTVLPRGRAERPPLKGLPPVLSTSAIEHPRAKSCKPDITQRGSPKERSTHCKVNQFFFPFSHFHVVELCAQSVSLNDTSKSSNKIQPFSNFYLFVHLFLHGHPFFQFFLPLFTS